MVGVTVDVYTMVGISVESGYRRSEKVHSVKSRSAISVIMYNYLFHYNLLVVRYHCTKQDLVEIK